MERQRRGFHFCWQYRQDRFGIIGITAYSAINTCRPADGRGDSWPRTSRPYCKDPESPQEIQKPSPQEADTWGRWEKYAPRPLLKKQHAYTKLCLHDFVLAEFKSSKWLISFIPAVCPGVRESSQQVTQVRDSYRWILNIPSKNLRMNFQEVNYYLGSEGNAHKLLKIIINFCNAYFSLFLISILFRCWLIWAQRTSADFTKRGSGL